jgi:hypothetical protein
VVPGPWYMSDGVCYRTHVIQDCVQAQAARRGRAWLRVLRGRSGWALDPRRVASTRSGVGWLRGRGFGHW